MRTLKAKPQIPWPQILDLHLAISDGVVSSKRNNDVIIFILIWLT